MKETLLNICKIITFIITFIILYVFLTYMKKPYIEDIDVVTGFYAEKQDSLDMVYIGGSAAFVYWAPLTAYEEFGIASYDFGANTMQAELYKYLIDETLKRQNPKLIIIDARAFQYRDKDQPPTGVAYRNVLNSTPFSLDKIKVIEQIVPKYLNDETNSYHLDLMLYHTNEDPMSLERAYKMIFNKNENIFKGFYFVPKVLKMERQEFETDEINPISEETESILKDLLKYIKEKKLEVLFVVSPYIQQNYQKASFNYIENIINEYGFNFIDFNEYDKEMEINYEKDFYNDNHVNIDGALKYTRFLSNYLKTNYDLPDRRLDENYFGWNELLPNWNFAIDQTKIEINRILKEDNQ